MNPSQSSETLLTLVAPFGQIHKDDILGFVLGGGPQHELGFCIEPLQIICAECRC